MSVSGLKMSPPLPTVTVWTADEVAVVEEGSNEEVVTVLAPEPPGFPYWALTRENKQRMGIDLKI